MRLFGHSCAIDCSHTDPALKCTCAVGFYIVPSNIDFIPAHESPHFHIQPKYLSHAFCADANCWNEGLCCPSIIDEITAIARYACRIVKAAWGMEFETTIGLQV
jgi:hypothetical protein